MPAARTIYFENGIGRIWEEPQEYLRLEYRPGPREEVQFRALLNHSAQALTRQGWDRMLIDQKAMTPFSASEQEWMMAHWLPRAVHENGYRYGAVVVAHNVYARLAMTQLILGSKDLPHTYRTFEDDSEGVAWLLAQRRT